MNRRHVLLVACLMLSVLGTAGCGESYDGPKLHPMSGKITVNGQPPGDQYRVYLVASSPGTPEPQLLVQPDGSYQALTGNKGWEGAAEGKYKVVVQSQRSEAAYQGGAAAGQSSLPQELAAYGSAETSPQEIEVTAGSNSIDITIP